MPHVSKLPKKLVVTPKRLQQALTQLTEERILPIETELKENTALLRSTHEAITALITAQSQQREPTPQAPAPQNSFQTPSAK